MVTEILRGEVQAESRAEMIDRVRVIAEAYFGTECLDFRLRSPEARGQQFHAAFEAQINHTPSNPGYGFAKCTGCNLTGVVATLTRAKWEDEDRQGHF